MSHRFDEGQAAGMNATQAALLGHPGGISLPGAPSTTGGGGGGTLSRFFDAQGNQLFVEDIANQQFVQDANGLFYIPQFDGLGTFTGVDLASSSQQKFLSEQAGGIGSTGGAGRAPPVFSSTQAAQTQAEEFARAQADRDAAIAAQAAVDRRRFDEEQAEADRQAVAEQNRIAQEAAAKRERLGVLSDLIQGFISAQQGARETLATLAPDPFALAAGINLMPFFGTTPQQAFQGTLENFVNQPIPQVGPNATLPQIGQAINTATTGVAEGAEGSG